jgi:hypothetical protein
METQLSSPVNSPTIFELKTNFYAQCFVDSAGVFLRTRLSFSVSNTVLIDLRNIIHQTLTLEPYCDKILSIVLLICIHATSTF